MVTHGNIVANEEMIRRAFDQSESSIIVSWLPLYHDMGLIGGVLQPLYVGASYDIDSGVPRYAFADLPDRIDYVVITHNHQDHCIFETLLQLRHKIQHILVPKNNGGWR